MGIRKSKLRALRGKDANKYYVFKDEKRRRSFLAIDKFLKIIYSLALFAFVIAMSIVAIGLAIFVMSYVLIIGFFIENNPGTAMMNFAIGWLPIILIIFIIAFVLKFIIEYAFLLGEMRSHRKSPEENKRYIDVGRAVLKSKIIALLAVIIAVGILLAIHYMMGDDGLEGWQIAAIGIIVIVYILNKIVSTKIFLRVQPQIKEIQEERSAEKDK